MEKPIRNITVIHQLLSINDIDVFSRFIYGYTELTIAPSKPDQEINTINLICKQCKLYGVDFNGNVKAQTYEYDESNGELCIKVPDNIKEQLKLGQQIVLAVDFCLVNPEAIHFDVENDLICNKNNRSSCWFPCIQGYNEFCTWKIVITSEYDSIASGQLIAIDRLEESPLAHRRLYQTRSSKRRKFHYFLGEPTCSPNIKIFVRDSLFGLARIMNL